jgi:anti-sigma regulatory factor (Ser/Thr protein kinase)
MAIAATESRSLVVVSLPGIPYSVQRARLYVRTALGQHDLDAYAEDVEAVTSELVSNAVTHTGRMNSAWNCSALTRAPGWSWWSVIPARFPRS